MKEGLFTYLYICLGPKNTKGGFKRDHSNFVQYSQGLKYITLPKS